jgi:hypothetical protein
VELKEEERDFTPVTDEPEADFCELAGAALHNAGINADDRIRAALGAATEHSVPAVIESNKDELVYEVTFKLPDAGLVPIAHNFAVPLGDDRDDTLDAPIVVDNVDAVQDAPAPRYPTQACRSAVGGQPYNEFAPRVAFLQLGTTRAHRNVLEAAKSARMSKEERMLATTSSNATPIIDDTIHRWDDAMTTTSKDELKVWGYVMTQYNLKPGLCKFGSKGQTAAVKELTQLHVMDTWTPMYANRISREQKMRALSSLLFLKEKRTGDVKGRACVINK